MISKPILAYALAGIVLGGAAPPPAQVTEPHQAALSNVSAVPDGNADSSALAEPAFLEGAVMSDEDLKEQRGGESIVIANQTMTAIMNGSILNGDFTAGRVSLSDNALSNFNGIGNILINTGAQNNLQSGMNLIINLTPPN